MPALSAVLPPKQVTAVRVMKECIRRGKKDFRIRRIANQIVRKVREGDWEREISAVVDAIKSKVRYSKDPYQVETIADAFDTWDVGFGDCDDLAVLVASMFESLGHPTRLRLVGKDRFSHVLVDVLIPNKGWMPVDLARPRPRVFKARQYPLSAPLRRV